MAKKPKYKRKVNPVTGEIIYCRGSTVMLRFDKKLMSKMIPSLKRWPIGDELL